MISKNDCILLLTDLQESGVDIKDNILKVIGSTSIPMNVLKFINSHRQLDLTQFYDGLRKSYNNKKSKLYINLIKGEMDKADDILTTLLSYALQAELFCRKATDVQMFIRHARLKEIQIALYKYYDEFDLSVCQKLLKIIRTDIIACETIDGRR